MIWKATEQGQAKRVIVVMADDDLITNPGMKIISEEAVGRERYFKSACCLVWQYGPNKTRTFLINFPAGFSMI